MTDSIKENKINIFYSLIISFSFVIVYLSGERTSFFLLILFFLTLFILSKYLRKLIIFIMMSSIVLSLIITNFKQTDQLNPSNRMFLKTYQQIIGDGKILLNLRKNFLIKSTYFPMIIMDIICWHIKFLKIILFLVLVLRGLGIFVEIKYIS